MYLCCRERKERGDEWETKLFDLEPSVFSGKYSATRMRGAAHKLLLYEWETKLFDLEPSVFSGKYSATRMRGAAYKLLLNRACVVSQ